MNREAARVAHQVGFRRVALIDPEAPVGLRLDTGPVLVDSPAPAPADQILEAIEMEGYFVERVTAWATR